MSSAPDDPRSDIATSPGDTAVTTVLEQLAGAGYGEDLRPAPPPASLHCGACGSVSAVDSFGDTWARRLEGASDPDDMVLVLAARCPVCGHGGSVVLGFGPESSPEDSAIVAQIPVHAVRIGGSSVAGRSGRPPRP